jgi:hypothetical protein
LIHGLVYNTLKLFMERDPRLYADCTSKYRNSLQMERKEGKDREKVDETWIRLEEYASRYCLPKNKAAHMENSEVNGESARQSEEENELERNFNQKVDMVTSELGSVKLRKRFDAQMTDRQFRRKSDLTNAVDEQVLRQMLEHKSLEVRSFIPKHR